MALRNMVFLLTTNFPQIHITGTASSVRESVEWLRAHPGQDAPDLIFMDVELSDGDCFGIFRETIITSQVVITTAYDSYAVKAFETGSISRLTWRASGGQFPGWRRDSVQAPHHLTLEKRARNSGAAS